MRSCPSSRPHGFKRGDITSRAHRTTPGLMPCYVLQLTWSILNVTYATSPNPQGTAITLTNVTIKNSGFWGLQHFYCNNSYMSHVTITAPRWTRQIAGFMPWSVINYTVEDSYVAVGDDAVAIMSGWWSDPCPPPLPPHTLPHYGVDWFMYASPRTHVRAVTSRLPAIRIGYCWNELPNDMAPMTSSQPINRNQDPVHPHETWCFGGFTSVVVRLLSAAQTLETSPTCCSMNAPSATMPAAALGRSRLRCTSTSPGRSLGSHSDIQSSGI